MSIKIAYLILSHEKIDRVKVLVHFLLESDNEAKIFIHFDKKTNINDFKLLQDFCRQYRACFIYRQIACEWGSFSLVEATLLLLRKSSVFKMDFYYLLSESCHPTSLYPNLKLFLSKNMDYSFIEINSLNWIFDGMKEDRFLYYHFLPFKKSPKLFKFMYKFQKLFKITKQIPSECTNIKLGSQWWCLNDDAVNKILFYIDTHKNISTFFKTVWIPDESFFQTIIWNIKNIKILNTSLTYYKFDKNGKPVTFKNLALFNKNMGKRLKTNKFFFRKVTCIMDPTNQTT